MVRIYASFEEAGMIGRKSIIIIHWEVHNGIVPRKRQAASINLGKFGIFLRLFVPQKHILELLHSFLIDKQAFCTQSAGMLTKNCT